MEIVCGGAPAGPAPPPLHHLDELRHDAHGRREGHQEEQVWRGAQLQVTAHNQHHVPVTPVPPVVQGQRSGGRTSEAEALGLEDALQRREVDDEELAHDGGQDGVAEGPVAAQPHLMDHPRLRTQQVRTRPQHT